MVALVTAGEDVVIDNGTNEDADRSVIIQLTDGGYLTAWDESHIGGQDIWAQRYDADGNAVDGAFQVNTYTTSTQWQPCATALDDGGYVILWSSDGQDGSSVGVYMQRFNADGTRHGTETRVNSSTDFNQRHASVEALPDGGFVAIWYSAQSSGSGSGIYGRIYDADGGSTGEVQLVAQIGAQEEDMDVAVLSDGTFVVTWSAPPNSSLPGDIYSRHFDAAGQALSSATVVHDDSNADLQMRPVIAALGDGYVIAWTSRPDQNIWNYDIDFRIYNADGEAITGSLHADGLTGMSMVTQSITALSDGGFVVTWYASMSSGGGDDSTIYTLYAQVVDSAGNKVGDVQVVTSGDYTTPNADVSATADGFAVTWTGEDTPWGDQHAVYRTDFTVVSPGRVLDGRGVSGTLTGGHGDDTYYVDSADDIVVEGLNGGDDLVNSGISYTLTDNAERLTLTGIGDLTATGNALANTLTGTDGGNLLDGKAGADTMIGGDGDDTYYVDHDDDLVTELSDKGADTVIASISYTLIGNIENLTLVGADGYTGAGNALDNAITGSDGDDLLYGNLGDDVIDGGAGADYMIGEQGDDTYYVTAGDTVEEGQNDGTDTIISGEISGLYFDYVENLVYTGSDDASVEGNGDNNVLTSGIGNDGIDGKAGADTMIGGAGDDTYQIDNTGDVVTELASEGTDMVYSQVDYDLGANVEKVQYTGSGNFHSTGNALDNTIIGGGGNDVLKGGDGNDFLDTVTAGNDEVAGGKGDDTYWAKSGDTLFEADGEGTDLVQTQDAVFSLDVAGRQYIENLGYIGGGSFTGTGNAGNNVLTGGVYDDTLYGGGGNDHLNGGVGADTLTGGQGDDTYVIGSLGETIFEDADGGSDWVYTSLNSYTLQSDVENLKFTDGGSFTGTGNAAANTIIGGSSNDVLDGKAGADTLTGGIGDDTFYVDNAGDSVIELGGQGNDTVRATVSYVLDSAAYVQVMELIAAGDLDLTGNNIANTLRGNAGSNRLDGRGGDDVLDGDAGADTMMGGTGDDTYYVDDAGDVVIEVLGEGVDTLYSSISYTLADSVLIQTLILTGGADLTLSGNNTDNTLTGNAGANVLDGKAGADTMIGGAGDDSFYVDNANDVVVEKAGEGTDVIYARTSYTIGLKSYVQVLNLTGTAAYSATGNNSDNALNGNSGRNTLTGLDGDDVLDGGLGNDILIGGAGNDTYYVDVAGDSVSELAAEGADLVVSAISYTLGAELEHLTLTGAGDLTATGNAAENTLRGNDGANIIDGKAGADRMYGGNGNDTFYVDNTGDRIYEYADQGSDIVYASASFTLGGYVQDLYLTGTGDLDGTGNGCKNDLYGTTGDNALDGKAGADRMYGGAGNDTYYVDNVSDKVIELAGEGSDIVYSSISYTLTAYVQDLYLTGIGDLAATGNGGENALYGNIGANVLDGKAGADRMYGGEGDDTYYVDDVADKVIERAGEGYDVVYSSVSYTIGTYVQELILTGADNLNATGSNGIDTLRGNSGDNYIYGRGGNDNLWGGAGADIFLFYGAVGADTIYDFNGSEGDRLDLSGYMENAATISHNGADVVIDLGSGNVITLISPDLNFQDHIAWCVA